MLSSHHRSVYGMDNTTWIPYTPALPLINTSNVGITPSVIGLTCVSCSLSIIGAILIFVAYCTCDCCRRGEETRRLLLYLTVSDLFVACANLAGTVRYVLVYNIDHITFYCSVGCDEFCIVQSFITSTASMWSFFWMTTIAIHLFIALVFCREGQHPCSIKIFTHIVCWLIPCKYIYKFCAKKKTHFIHFFLFSKIHWQYMWQSRNVVVLWVSIFYDVFGFFLKKLLMDLIVCARGMVLNAAFNNNSAIYLGGQFYYWRKQE